MNEDFCARWYTAEILRYALGGKINACFGDRIITYCGKVFCLFGCLQWVVTEAKIFIDIIRGCFSYCNFVEKPHICQPFSISCSYFLQTEKNSLVMQPVTQILNMGITDPQIVSH